MTPRLEAPPVPGSAPSPAGGTVRRFLLIFLALAALVTATSFETLFVLPAHEEGDDAANALQIQHAKRFTELHGNYSRWGFHHPGPAFFYSYALGEIVLHDLTRIAPRPRNAHVYAGVLVQLGFYALALACLSRYARWPLLTLALGLAFGAWHFALVERIIFSIWPPDVLLMPFLCFLVACAGVLIGDLLALPVAVLAGGFLVHGHVAQPLFVGPMLGFALWRGLPWRQGGGRALLRSAPVRVALGLGALFVLPLALDLLGGRHSNAYDIWLHLRYQAGAGQSLWQSVLCYASAFIALNDPTLFNTLEPAVYQPFRDRGWLLALWAAVALGVVWWLRRPSPAAPDRRERARRFGRAWAGLLLLAGGLTLVWGMRQDGGFTNFNSHFNHTLAHAHGLLALFALVALLPRGSKWVAAALTAAALVAFSLRLPYQPETYSRGDELATHVRSLLRADPKPDAPKLLIFDREPGVPHWYEAVTLARQFQQAGVTFYVSGDWRVMFGADVILPDDPALLARVSVWKLLARQPDGGDPADDGGVRHRLNRECDVVFPDAPTVSDLNLRIDFARVKTSPLIFYGFGQSEGTFAWTNAKLAQLKFHAPDTASPLVFTLTAAGLSPSRARQPQTMRLLVNGVEVGKSQFGREPGTFTCEIPAAVWNAHQPRLIALEIPDAVSPARIGKGADRRVLGLRVNTISIAPRP